MSATEQPLRMVPMTGALKRLSSDATRSAAMVRVWPDLMTSITWSAAVRRSVASLVVSIGGVSRNTMSNSSRQRSMMAMSSAMVSAGPLPDFGAGMK